MLPTAFTPKLFSLLRQGYAWDTAKADILAGLTVAIVALPLAMALGIASGASPDKGLVTAVVAGFLISFLGGSRVQIGGPTGAFIVVVFSVIANHGYDGLLLATLLAGIILIIAGYAKFGQVIHYIPYPVITGFTAGIAVIIASSQVKDFLGLNIQDVPAEFIPKWQVYLTHLDSTNLAALTVGAMGLAVILILKRFTPKWPGYLIAVTLASLSVYFFHLPIDTIGSRFPDIPSGLPLPSLPAWNMDKFLEIVPSAFTIAFLAGIEALLSATVADGMTGYKHRPNQELVGQGVANIASTLFVVAWNMSEIHHFIHIFRLSKSDRLVMLLTFALTVLVDLTVAIGVGVTLASLLFMHQMSQSALLHAQGRKIRDTFGDGKEEESQRDELPEGVEVFRITGPIFFGMAGTMLETLQAMGEMPKVLILRMKLVPYMDVAGLNAVKNLIKTCESKGSKVIISGLQQQPKDMLFKAGVHDNQNTIFIVPSYDEAVSLSLKLPLHTNSAR